MLFKLLMKQINFSWFYHLRNARDQEWNSPGVDSDFRVSFNYNAGPIIARLNYSSFLNQTYENHKS